MHYRTKTLYTASIILVTFSAVIANATEVYKCKDDNGNTVFSQTGCIDRESEIVDVQPATGYDDPYKVKPTLTERRKHLDRADGKPMPVKRKGDPEAKKKARCNRYRSKIASIKSKLKTGLSKVERDRLRAKMQRYKGLIDTKCIN